MNELIAKVFRTAPATPGLIINKPLQKTSAAYLLKDMNNAL